LIESERLADEAEFTDLTLNLEKTVVVTQKRIEKNTAKLEKAAKHGPDTHHMMVDEVEIQMVKSPSPISAARVLSFGRIEAKDRQQRLAGSSFISIDLAIILV
jgi:hypothetical protein